METYEPETLEVTSLNTSSRQLMTVSRLRELFGEHRWHKDVFACLCNRQSNSADIELMNSEGLS